MKNLVNQIPENLHTISAFLLCFARNELTKVKYVKIKYYNKHMTFFFCRK